MSVLETLRVLLSRTEEAALQALACLPPCRWIVLVLTAVILAGSYFNYDGPAALKAPLQASGHYKSPGPCSGFGHISGGVHGASQRR